MGVEIIINPSWYGISSEEFIQLDNLIYHEPVEVETSIGYLGSVNISNKVISAICHVDFFRKMIKHVIFNDPATIVIWQDGTKTVTKCHPDDSYDKEKGLMACIIKYLTGNTGRWNEILKDWIDYESDERKRLSTSQWEENEPKG